MRKNYRPKRDPWLNNIPERFEKSSFTMKKEVVEAVNEKLQELGSFTSMSQSYFSEICGQKSYPSYDIRRALAAVFGCTVEELDK